MIIITIAGRLGRDPEVRFTSSGQKVTTFRVATNTRRSSKDETIWWRVTVWGESFDRMISFLKKGSAVIVVGDLSKPEIFNDREGKPQVSMNITASNIMFSPFGKSDKLENTSIGVENTEKNIDKKASGKDDKKDSKKDDNESLEEDFAGFAFGAKKDDNDDFSDDEIPF